ncbi:hypothetical protein CDD83_10323 [Cordyceps sp. RAO-2017]|nr:hypothetical protein CDD83_10323 [Cordyceps sp. RAO-2017]
MLGLPYGATPPDKTAQAPTPGGERGNVIGVCDSSKQPLWARCGMALPAPALPRPGLALAGLGQRSSNGQDNLECRPNPDAARKSRDGRRPSFLARRLTPPRIPPTLYRAPTLSVFRRRTIRPSSVSVVSRQVARTAPERRTATMEVTPCLGHHSWIGFALFTYIRQGKERFNSPT